MEQRVPRTTAPRIGHTAAWVAALLLALCARDGLAGAKAPQEYLDEDTGATITIVGEPLTFAAARPDLAANLRDYVTLAAAAVDLNRKVRYVLIAYFWSTVDPRVRRAPPRAPDSLVLQADDRRIELTLRDSHEAGIGAPVQVPAGTDATPSAYGTDLATLRFIAEARRLTLVSDSEEVPLGYELWEDRRATLRAFVRHMNGED
ncbi:MAG: hypothetical protein JOZ89_04270 [Gammaproteobacteria bacterium]|nr:hypothetical protein [Gammaproteobacteria bacterium]